MWACDFFNVETMLLRRPQVFFIEHTPGGYICERDHGYRRDRGLSEKPAT
jgi:hypothetical protein